jgi:hypothetical protein
MSRSFEQVAEYLGNKNIALVGNLQKLLGQSLHEILGARPSTGCMAVDMIRRVIGEGLLTLYGYKIFQSDSWHERYSFLERLQLWRGLKKAHLHDGVQEAALPKEQLTIVPTQQSEAL